MLYLLVAEVAYDKSNQTKTIIQIQQPIINLYLKETSSAHKKRKIYFRMVSFTHGCLDGLKLFAKKTFKVRNDVLNVGIC
jgi:L-ribulose-5-phosphate 3-epimerase UlaE